MPDMSEWLLYHGASLARIRGRRFVFGVYSLGGLGFRVLGLGGFGISCLGQGPVWRVIRFREESRERSFDTSLTTLC